MRKAVYWLPPLMVLVTCLFGIWYSLTAPGQSLQVSDVVVTNLINSLIPTVTPRMFEYSRIRYAVHFVWIALEVGFLCCFLQLGWSNALRSYAQTKSRFLFFQLVIFLSIFSITMTLVFSPFSYMTGFWLKHHYGLSNQSLTDWLIDAGKALAVNFCVELPVWWLIFTALRKFSRSWPFIVFIGSVPIIFALTFIAPLVIDPVFNKIEPMPESSLRTSIESLVAASGIPDTPIFTCDRHKQTKEINAYVTGLGSSARVVLWDTTIEKLPPEQVLCVVAHELGHYVLKHVYWGCAIGVLISLCLVPINIWITPMIFKNAPPAWKISSLQDIAGIPLLLLCVSILVFSAEPFINGYSRGIEHDADVFGLKLFKNKVAFASTFAALSRDNLAEPNPPALVELWLFSHPSLGERIRSSLTSDTQNKN